jgi:hypothetical protein
MEERRKKIVNFVVLPPVRCRPQYYSGTIFTTTCCIITGLFISLKKHCENVSEKEPIFADEGATVRALLKNKNAEK